MAFDFQVALLDFGATRGFDASFTDVYIEVNKIYLCEFIILLIAGELISVIGFYYVHTRCFLPS